MFKEIQIYTLYFWQKVLASIPLCFISFLKDQNDILHGILYIVIIDTILGMFVGIKYKKFSSRRLSKLANKAIRYGFAMMSVWVLGAVEPNIFGWAFHWLGIFIILTEIFSNFEKLALLGFKIPTRLLSRLNKDFKEYYMASNGQKEKIIDKLTNYDH